MVSNLDKTATNLSNLDLQKTLNTLNSTIGDLKAAIGKFDKKDGTLGLLLNDTKLYENLRATSNKFNLLIDNVNITKSLYYIGFTVNGGAVAVKCGKPFFDDHIAGNGFKSCSRINGDKP